MDAPAVAPQGPRPSGRMAGKAVVLFTLLLVFALGYLLHGRLTAATPAGASSAQAQETPGLSSPQPAMWTCAMHPQIRQPGPGKCPICGMDLVPVFTEAAAEAEGSVRRFTTTPAAKALMEIRTSPVERRPVEAEIRMVGKVEYDETTLGYITAWVPGRLDHLYVNYTGVDVKKGDPMVEIYSPELVTAQQELLQAIQAVRDLGASKNDLVKESSERMVADAREKLRLLGLPAEQIEEIEKRGTASDHITLKAPVAGTVIQKDGREGMYVETGTQIYAIANLATVWVKLDAYESDLAWLHENQEAVFSTEAYPGEVFRGRIVFIDPVLNEATRTVKVRVNVPNPEGKLKPGMFVRALVHAAVPSLEGETQPPLVIPASAALITGKRAIVYIEVPDVEQPAYEGREIVLGPRVGDYYAVRNGLEEGELVVTNGSFKIDSALQIQAKPSMMAPEGGGAASLHQHGGEAATHATSGVGERVVFPEAFLRGIQGIEDAYAAVSQAVDSGDLPSARDKFRGFGQALQLAQSDLLEGHARMAWQELAMLLSNDSVEGAAADKPRDLQRALQSLTSHMESLRKQLGVTHEHEVSVAATTAVPAPFKSQLADLLQSYFALQAALAGDDLRAAKDSARTSLDALNRVDMALLQGDDHMAWMKLSSQIEQALTKTVAADDLATIRTLFAPLSDAMLQAVNRFGATRTAYELHCPMAFQGQGANWLQANPEVHNPYFGAAMPTCGDVVNVISSQPDQTSGGHHRE